MSVEDARRARLLLEAMVREAVHDKPKADFDTILVYVHDALAILGESRYLARAEQYRIVREEYRRLTEPPTM